MRTSTLARLSVVPLVLGLTAGQVALAALALAHGDGDVATNTRAAQVEKQGEGRRMRHVANLQYNRSGEAQNGSDIEFMRLGQRDYALAGTLREGLQVIDITRPRDPRRVAVFDCDISQGDIQVWKDGGRVLASYTADGTVGAAGAASQCGRDLGLEAGDAGTVLVDLTTPSRPQSLSFLKVPRGSHNMTLHPSGDYLYNSNSDLITSTEPSVRIFDVRNPLDPKRVRDLPLPFVPTSLGSEAHDITFNANGDRMYVAALSQTLIFDTSDPRAPREISQIVDPAIQVVHQSDPVRVQRPDGSWRRLLIITDERAGAATGAECPGGGLHVYDVTGRKELDPQKVGTWFIPRTTVEPGVTCTSHVLRVYPKQEMMTIAWYAAGVRVLDISGLATVEGSPTSIGIGNGVGMREIGHYAFGDSDTWSFKTNRINRDGSFFGYGNDLVRGFDVYRFAGFRSKRVEPLVPRDIAPRSTGGTDVASLAPLAVLLPALLGAGLLRRRSRRD